MGVCANKVRKDKEKKRGSLRRVPRFCVVCVFLKWNAVRIPITLQMACSLDFDQTQQRL